MTISDELYISGLKKAKHVVWVLSDLQQGLFDNMKRCLDTCMDDYYNLGRPAEAVWYLGDAIEGRDEENIRKMVEAQEKAFESLDVPLTYTNGNHDFDFARKTILDNSDDPIKVPFYEMVKNHPGWHVAPSFSDPYFTQDFHDFKLFIFGDHVDKDKKWLSTHSKIMIGEEFYPYDEEYANKIREEMASAGKPVITLAHCGFPGGNRAKDSDLLGKLQPLPLNVRLHLYGHSHIGEYKCPGERVFSQISSVNWQDIPQIDVASFENIRGCYCHSVILQIYKDNSFGIFFRNHDSHCFESAYFPPQKSYEKPGDYEKYRYINPLY